ncbi:MAG: hypothetical protein ACRCXL_09655, partial [Dermatophilaceae bacterium]
RLDRQAYRVTIGDTADVYAVEAFGAHRRLLVTADHEVVEDQGDPLAVESAVAGEDDLSDRHLAIVDRLLGARLFDLLEAPMTPVSASPDRAG